MVSAITVTTETAMGRSISVVEVLEIHMLTNAAAIMNPATRPRASAPDRANTLSAMRRWRPQRSIARAITKPPKNK